MFVDVERNTFNLDVETLEAAIEGSCPQPAPAAVIVVDFFSQPSDYRPVCAVAEGIGQGYVYYH